MTLAIFLCVLIVGILLGIPVAFSLLLASVALMVHLDLFSADILAQSLVNGVDSFALLAIPFFLVAGEVMAVGGLSQRIVRLAMAWVGHNTGGLGYVATFTAIILADLYGSAAADAAALVAILYPMMRGAGYPEARSAGLLAAGGIIAPVIPPSVPLILREGEGGMNRPMAWKIFMASIAAAILVASTSTSMAATELKLAHAAPDTDLQQDLATFFAEQVDKRTGGEVTVKIFPQGQLGNDQQMITGVRSGIIDIAISGLNNFDGLMPEVGGLLLPYMFTSREHACGVLDGEVGQGVLASFEQFGMKGLGFPENGYRNITNSRQPIRTPEDVVGLKIRTNNSVALNEMFAMLKANPQPLPVSELYTALETGVVDAQEHPINITHSFRYDEVQKYLSLTEHSYSMLVIVMNLNKFNSLTPEQQAVVLEVAAEATDFQRNLSIEREAGILAELAERGMEINDDVDKAAFQEAVRGTWDTYTGEYGDDMVNKIQAAQ